MSGVGGNLPISARAMHKAGLEDDAPIEWMEKMCRSLQSANAAVTVLEDATAAQAVEAFAHDVQKALSWVAPEVGIKP